jgi:hypothetical protein
MKSFLLLIYVFLSNFLILHALCSALARMFLYCCHPTNLHCTALPPLVMRVMVT